jgi:streptogramin lyase
LRNPTGVAVDAAGNVLIADLSNSRIRSVDAVTGVITTVAGNGNFDFSGDGGPATAASLGSPSGVAVDAAGNLLIAQSNARIRRDAAVPGVITPVAGNGAGGFSGDGGPATAASFSSPLGVAVDAAGNVLIADQSNSRIRRVDAVTGVITTVAGNGTFGFSGDGGPATAASLSNPVGVAVDAAGNVLIADPNNFRIRRVDAVTGVITTVAGSGTFGFSGDGGPATAANLSGPFGVAVDAAGNVLIADRSNQRIRRVDAVTGVITTAAGNGASGFSGDGGPATAASLSCPLAVA